MAISCKSGGFKLIVQASVCFAVIFGFRVWVLGSGMSCLYKFSTTYKWDAFSNLPIPENRGSEKQRLIMPDRLKERERASTSKEGLKGAFLSFHPV